jgi:hypothetical protein
MIDLADERSYSLRAARRVIVVLLVAFICSSGSLRAHGTAAGEIIDRILAVVEGQLITLSDVRAVTRLGLETVPAGGDPTRLALDKLIDRQLVLIEVERYAPPDPDPAAIDARLTVMRAKFKDALEFETTLHQVGMTVDHLRRYVRDTLRIDSYLQQRFAAAIQPGDDEIAGYYRLHAAEFTRSGTLAPFEEVRNEVRARLVDERRSALARDWLAGLRRRANIVDLFLVK